MLDHQEARLWADNHTAFSDWVADLVHQAREAFAVLAAHRYDRPWARETKRR